MIASDQMTPAELAALLHFHADAGVEWLLEDDAIDRVAEFAAAKAARSTAAARPAPAQREDARPAPMPDRKSQEKAAPRPIAPTMVIPDGEAVALAQKAAAAASSLAELKDAMAAFTACNLRNSARNLVFADGNAESGVMVIGGLPSADDDRDGIPFSGKDGEMLGRMIGAIGLSRETALISTVIPWRTPGDRAATVPEMDICRPFIERQIALASPQHILLLGNFAARVLLRSNDTIHHLRGQWQDIAIAERQIRAMATLHPQDLSKAPAGKRLAWQDLLAFKAQLGT